MQHWVSVDKNEKQREYECRVLLAEMLALVFDADKLVPESDSKSVRVTCRFCHSKLLPTFALSQRYPVTFSNKR